MGNGILYGIIKKRRGLKARQFFRLSGLFVSLFILAYAGCCQNARAPPVLFSFMYRLYGFGKEKVNGQKKILHRAEWTGI